MLQAISVIQKGKKGTQIEPIYLLFPLLLRKSGPRRGVFEEERWLLQEATDPRLSTITPAGRINEMFPTASRGEPRQPPAGPRVSRVPRGNVMHGPYSSSRMQRASEGIRDARRQSKYASRLTGGRTYRVFLSLPGGSSKRLGGSRQIPPGRTVSRDRSVFGVVTDTVYTSVPPCSGTFRKMGFCGTGPFVLQVQIMLFSRRGNRGNFVSGSSESTGSMREYLPDRKEGSHHSECIDARPID